MKDIYVEKFSQMLDHTAVPIAPTIHTYLACLLAAHVEKTGFFEEPFGLRYMEIDSSVSAKELGDNCLVIVGIFSGYRGMNDSYYSSIGAGSYWAAATATGSSTFETLAYEFDDVCQILQSVQPPRFF